MANGGRGRAGMFGSGLPVAYLSFLCISPPEQVLSSILTWIFKELRFGSWTAVKRRDAATAAGHVVEGISSLPLSPIHPESPYLFRRKEH